MPRPGGRPAGAQPPGLDGGKPNRIARKTPPPTPLALRGDRRGRFEYTGQCGPVSRSGNRHSPPPLASEGSALSAARLEGHSEGIPAFDRTTAISHAKQERHHAPSPRHQDRRSATARPGDRRPGRYAGLHPPAPHRRRRPGANDQRYRRLARRAGRVDQGARRVGADSGAPGRGGGTVCPGRRPPAHARCQHRRPGRHSGDHHRGRR